MSMDNCENVFEMMTNNNMKMGRSNSADSNSSLHALMENTNLPNMIQGHAYSNPCINENNNKNIGNLRPHRKSEQIIEEENFNEVKIKNNLEL
jgi:hypothetical protein